MTPSPAETATREHPLVLVVDGEYFRLWTVAPGPSMSGPARISNARWVISVNGKDYRGWEADLIETEAEIRERLSEWRHAAPEGQPEPLSANS
jgi:hypothetical protein